MVGSWTQFNLSRMTFSPDAFDAAMTHPAFDSVVSTVQNAVLAMPSTATLATPMSEEPRREASFYKAKYSYVDPVPHDSRLAAPECAGGHPYKAFFNQSMDKRSRAKEDSLIYRLFFKNRPLLQKGVVMEIGAFDGLRESNSHFFESCLRWDSVLVEANPKVFPKLLRNRPYGHRFHFAPSCNRVQELANETIPFHISVFTSAAQYDVIKPQGNKGFVNVPCGRLTPVLTDLFPDRTINFFSLDVEGAEPLILNNLDLNRVKIEVIIAESRNNNCMAICPAREQVRDILQNQYGYHLEKRTIPMSDLFIHPSIINETDWSKSWDLSPS